MLRLYYTTTVGANNPQDKIVNSIGGYKSSTAVSNDIENNLFDDISLQMMSQARPQYIALVLVNEGSEITSNVELWFEQDPMKVNFCSFKIGATLMSKDAESNPIMEMTNNTFSKPFQTELYEATTESKVTVGDIEPGEMIGLWISRVPHREIMIQDYDNVAERDSESRNRYKPVEKEKIETCNLQISWD